MQIDPRHLAFLLAIHRHGSFSRASEALRLSQPALSASIAALEQAVGCKVLDRSAKGAVLNELGRSLAIHATTLENTLRVAAEDARRHREGASRRLLLGGTPIALIRYAVPIIAQLSETRPFSVDVTEGAEDRLLELLLSGSIDLFLGTVGADEPLSEVVEIPLSVATLSGFIRSGRIVSLQDLSTWQGQWALPMQGSSFRRQVETVFAASGIPFPKDYIGCHTIAVQKELAMRMDCLTILPPEAAALEVRNGLLVEIPLPVGEMVRTLGIKYIRHKALSPEAKSFVGAASAMMIKA